MEEVKLTIPRTIPFSSLGLKAEDGKLSFDWKPVERICEANDLDPELFAEDNVENLVELIVIWYSTHLTAGGKHDPVGDALLAKVRGIRPEEESKS